MTPIRHHESEDTMHARENRLVPMVALIAMLIVSAVIVGLTYWSGDLFGPWASAPSSVVEQPGVPPMPAMGESEAAGDSTAAFDASRARNGPDAGTAGPVSGAPAPRQAMKDAE